MYASHYVGLPNTRNLALILICGNNTQPILNRIFFLEPRILPLPILLYNTNYSSSFSWRISIVYTFNQGPKLKEIGMAENKADFILILELKRKHQFSGLKSEIYQLIEC